METASAGMFTCYGNGQASCVLVIQRAHQAIKREETAIAEEKEKLESRRASVIREFKRIRDEDRSRFNRFPTMAGRYVLMNLLGKGGFSEVCHMQLGTCVIIGHIKLARYTKRTI